MDVGSHGSLSHSPFTLGSFIFNQIIKLEILLCMSLLTGTRAQAVGLSVLSKKLSRLHTACPGIFDLQQSKDRKYLMRNVIIKGICQIIQRTIQRHAGSTFIVI